MGRLQQFIFPPWTSSAGGEDASSVTSGEKGGRRHRRRRGRGRVPHRGGWDRRGHQVIRVPQVPSPDPIPGRPRELLPRSI